MHPLVFVNRMLLLLLTLVVLLLMPLLLPLKVDPNTVLIAATRRDASAAPQRPHKIPEPAAAQSPATQSPVAQPPAAEPAAVTRDKHEKTNTVVKDPPPPASFVAKEYPMLKAAGFEDEDETRGIISKRWKTTTDYSSPSSHAPLQPKVQRLSTCTAKSRPSALARGRHPDWVFAAVGTAASSWASQFRLSPAPSSYGDHVVHLVNRLSSGGVSLVEGTTQVRGHRNADPRDVAAGLSITTAVRWTKEEPPATRDAPPDCEPPVRMRFEFTDRSRAPSTHLHVGADGVLGAAPAVACATEHACTFELVPVDAPAGDVAGAPSHAPSEPIVWYHLLSARTGQYVQLQHVEMPEPATWLGVHPPHAVRKPRPPSFRPRSAQELAKQGCSCPIRGGGPRGWQYNCTLWAPLIDKYLAPWVGGNVTATVLDMAFWKGLYSGDRSHAIPGMHVSSVHGRLHVRENVDYRLPLYRDMLRTVHKMVPLPDVEFVTHLWDHPKVDRETPLPVFAHYADVAHRDVPIPAPWSWDDRKHDFPQPWVNVGASACAQPWGSRTNRLYFRGGCNGPTRGWRGPLWRFYPRKRANRLSATTAGVDAGVYDHCDSPKLSPIEWAWDAQMEAEMRREAPKKPIEPFGRNCNYQYLLHVDGNAASSRLASELHVGSTVFKQQSFSSEYFYPLLRPWMHYIPVAANLHDVPEKLAWAKANPRAAEAIATTGQRFARDHLHLRSIACYWWQLLSAFAELQDFHPRSSTDLGFKAL